MTVGRKPISLFDLELRAGIELPKRRIRFCYSCLTLKGLRAFRIKGYGRVKENGRRTVLFTHTCRECVRKKNKN